MQEQQEQKQKNKTELLELKDLEQYTGTEKYYNILGVNVTDGVYYVMESGYSWVVTDAVAILKFKLQKHPFVTIDLKIKDKQAKIIYSDGNGNILYKQDYEYTDAKKDLKFYYTDKVLMLCGEY